MLTSSSSVTSCRPSARTARSTLGALVSKICTFAEFCPHFFVDDSHYSIPSFSPHTLLSTALTRSTSCLIRAGECGELGRHAPPMKIKVNGELEYDMLNILQHHITPGPMYIRTGATSEGVLSGTTGTGANRDAQVRARLTFCLPANTVSSASRTIFSRFSLFLPFNALVPAGTQGGGECEGFGLRRVPQHDRGGGRRGVRLRPQQLRPAGPRRRRHHRPRLPGELRCCQRNRSVSVMRRK